MTDLKSVSFAVLSAACALTAQDRMTPELLWELGRVSDPQLSPDGRDLLYHVRSYQLDKNSGRTEVWHLDLTSGARRSLLRRGSCFNARWSPDGERVAMLISDGGAPQVWTVRIDTGEEVQVTDRPGGVANLAWSPDGAWLSFTADVKLDPDVHDRYPDLPLAEAQIYDDLMVRHWDGWKDGTYSHLFVVPANGSGAVRDLMAELRVDTPLKPFGGGEQIAWAPDSSGLVYTGKRSATPEVSTNSDLWWVALDGGEHRNLTTGLSGFDIDPAFSPDGRWLAWESMARNGYESDQNRLMVRAWPLGAGPRRVDTWDQTVADFTWTPDSKGFLLTADWQGTRQVFELPLAGGEPRAVTAGRWHFGAVRPAPDGSAFYAVRQQTERPYEVVKVELGGEPQQGTMLTDVNGELYAGVQLPRVEERWFEASDGERIHAWVIKPPGFDADEKYPMLLYCQGGPQSQVGQWFSYRWNFHLMAAQGYVVLAVNRRGLPGFGTQWNEAISRDWGGQPMQDLFSATDVMFEESWVDRRRTAAIGASYGGYAVYWLMGHDQEDRFCAMVAHCGVFNLESMYLSTEELHFPNWDLGGPYWRDDAVRRDYERFSPHEFVREWDTPLMVIHGQKDFRVPVEQGLQAFTAAQLRGVPSRFVYFPRESHWVLGPQNGVLWHRLFFDWLDRYCK